jgi:predicted amidohydrolase/pyrrolidone-carboxylate peptidase
MKRYIFILTLVLAILCFIDGYSETFASTTKIAAIQYRAIPFNKSVNINHLKSMIKQAATEGARLIVLPEMCTTGLTISGPAQAQTLAETIPGQTTNIFTALAKAYSVHIILGLPEADLKNNKYYNTQIIINDDGCIIGKYRKKHLYGPDHHWATAGNSGYKYVETNLGKVGLGICYDINFQDMLDYFSSVPIDIFAFSTNWVNENVPFSYWSKIIKERRYNFIAANNWGEEPGAKFSGGSIIISAEGKTLSQTKDPSNTIIFAGVDLPRKTKNILLTGFEPFGGFAVNSSWEAIKSFDKQIIKGYSIKSVLLPVEYKQSVTKLLNAIDSDDPDIIISFGMAPDEFIRLEKIAHNKTYPYEDNIGDIPGNPYILKDMPPTLETGLPLKKIYNDLLAGHIKAGYSADAGSYVCNYLFYNLMTFGNDHRKRDCSGFIHLPPVSDNFPPDKLRQSVKVMLNTVIDHEIDKMKCPESL